VNETSVPEYLALGVAALFAVYLVARLITAAFFQSKQQYERQQHVKR
jgi:hypothetical protein